MGLEPDLSIGTNGGTAANLITGLEFEGDKTAITFRVGWDTSAIEFGVGGVKRNGFFFVCLISIRHGSYLERCVVLRTSCGSQTRNLGLVQNAKFSYEFRKK